MSRVVWLPVNQHISVYVPDVVSTIDTDGLCLDCGCGRGGWAEILYRCGLQNEIVGVDIWKPYLQRAKKGKYADLVLCTVTHLPFRTDLFHHVLAVEILEHLSKRDGELFLREMQRVCRRKITLTTPNGYVPCEGDSFGETHRSGWTRRELEQHGYRLIREYPDAYHYAGSTKSNLLMMKLL